MISVPEEGPKEEATHTHQLSGASYVLPTEMYKAKRLAGGGGISAGRTRREDFLKQESVF